MIHMKTKQVKILKIFFSVFYCLIGAEIFLRIIAPVPILPRRVCAASYGIRGNKPNQTYWQRTPETTVKLKTNSKGIRADREIPYEKPVGVYRIVLLGDSFGMGYEVDYNDMFSTRLEWHLRESYQINAEVINLSTSGHGTAEELIVLQNEGLRYHPDIVLVQWHSTDYQDNIRSDLYGLKDGALYVKNETYLPAVKIRETLEKLFFYVWVEENSQFYTFFREFAAVKAKALLDSLRSTRVRPNTVNQNNNESKEDYSTQLSVALLDKIKAVCSDRKIEFMILDIPRPRGSKEFYSVFPFEPDQLNGRYYLYSPIDDFKKANGQKIFWEKGHGHLTPLGCDIVGKGLAEYVVKNALLK
ncbi:MAG: hypothetical protein A4E53_00911 [Pelotomaculum sp. PtaB.Bin104]|nr:MAG: hypothetical protein A4E53_00911 [Pelotomaculum sp. PtaB.Bin104]